MRRSLKGFHFSGPMKSERPQSQVIGEQMVNAILKDRLTVLIKARQHELISDGPSSLEGLDLGLTPHELVEAALGACTEMTLRLYAHRKKWDLQKVDIEVRIVSENEQETIFQEDLRLEGNLTEEQRHRLFEIACRCPIHRLLRSHIIIDTNCVDSSGKQVWTHR